jgi:hypothetical protein
MINKKIRKLLKDSKGAKTVYGLGKHLGVTPQAGDYKVKKKDYTQSYKEMEKIAEYFEVDVNDIID